MCIFYVKNVGNFKAEICFKVLQRLSVRLMNGTFEKRKHFCNLHGTTDL